MLIALGCIVVFPRSAVASVSISSFTAKWNGAQVSVAWTTATELNNSGFYVQRSESASGGFTRVSPLIPAQNVGSITGSSYAFTDKPAVAGKTYYYKLESRDTSGGTKVENSVATAQVSATATPTKTTAPIATATRTKTAVPPTATLTSAPPTATNTVPPGFPTLTPMPKATPTTQKVAAAPSPTIGRIAGKTFTPMPASPTPRVTNTPPRIALAPVAPTADAPLEDDLPEDDVAPTGNASSPLQTIIGVGIILGSTMLVGLAFLFFIAATVFFIRAQLRS